MYRAIWVGDLLLESRCFIFYAVNDKSCVVIEIL